MAKLWQFWQGHPKPVFSKKMDSRDQEKFFKNRLKSSPRVKGSKALCRKRHYPLISIHLKWNNRKRFRRKQRLQKCKNGQVIGIFARSPKTRIFGKSAKIKVQRLENILATKVQEWPSYRNFRKVTKNPHFLKKCKGGTKGNFQKSPKK